MFRAQSYPREVKFYTDNVRASMTNSMSECSAVQYSTVQRSIVESCEVQREEPDVESTIELCPSPVTMLDTAVNGVSLAEA